MNSEIRESLQTFESGCHKDLVTQLLEQIKRKEPLRVLDLSLDGGIFTSLIIPHVQVEKIICAVRDDQPNPNLSELVEFQKVNFTSKAAIITSLPPLGLFDLIVVKEMISEVQERLAVFFDTLKGILRDGDSFICLIVRPKNPPLPIPQVAMETWRKTLPSRDEIFQAVFEAGLLQDTYSISNPVKVDKFLWSKVLKSRSLAAIKFCSRCSDKEIDSFIEFKEAKMAFEEKFFLAFLMKEPQ